MAKGKKKKTEQALAPEERPARKRTEEDEIDFPTVIWSLVILAALVLIHRLIWGG